MPKSRRSSMQQAMLNMNKHIYSDEVRLMMECTEEDLLPCQRLSYKSALDEYNRVNKYIADVQTGKIQMTNVPNSTISLVTDPNAVVRPKQAQKSNQSNDPDVIVIGESPAQQKKGGQNIPALPNVDNISIPALPDNISGQQIITFPQQVYNQFVNGQQSNVVKVGNQIFIRPIMSVAPQQNGAQGVSYSVNNPSMVRPTSLLKRQAELDADYKKRLLTTKNEMDSSGNWVPLDEFYYGKKEGDPTYVEDKGEYRFKCWYCSKMLYNNVKIMMHMQGHIDSEKQHNLDLSDLTQCKHCYKQFDTPFEMQTHIEKVHMYNSNVLMCRICEKDCDSRMTLTSHMRTNHNACEMPYICHLCGFRSSMYSDVVDHFKKKHDSSANLLCLYCLKAFNIKFISTGWGQTQNYYHHLLKHQAKNKVKKCQVCKLTFFNPADLKAHRQKDHLANVKGVIGMNSKYTTPDQVMIKVPEQGLQPKPIKSLNAPTVSKVRDNHLLLPRVVNDADCLECKTSMSSVEHYKKYIQCSMCRFATSCSFAYANHMMGFHSGKMTTLSLNIPQEKPMEHVMYCMCGYASLYGNKIANHMVYCTKRTCYKDKPDVQIQEYDNKEMQDPRKKPGASLLDVLGLVKKPSSGEGDDINESNEDIEGDDDKLREGGSTSSDSQGKKSTDWFKIKLSDSSTTDSQEVEKKDDNVDKGDVVEIPDEPSIMDKTDLNSAKSNEDNNEDDGGGEDVLSEKSVPDNVKNNSEDITEVFNDSLKDSTLKIKDIESLKTNVDQSDDSTDKTEGKSEENESQEDKSSADSEVPMETSIDQPEIQEKDNLVIEGKNHDLSDGSSEEQTKSENSSESTNQKEAPSTTSNSDDGEFISKEPKDMPDEVSAIEAVDISTSDNIQIPYTDNKTESSSVVTEKSTENKEDKVSQSEVPLNEASTHSIGISEDKEVNISPTTEESILETSSQDTPIDEQITDDSTKHSDIVDTIDKPSINETSLEISPEELHPTTESFKQESKTETPTDTPTDTVENPIQTESAFHSSGEQLMEGTNLDTESQHHTDENPTKTQPDHSESSLLQANNPPQQQNQKDTSAESTDKPEDNSSSQRYDDSHNRRYSDEHNRAYDRERSNREHRDRDRSYQHRNEYRDRSRDYHYDRDRKYDRDYDRHGRDRNRDHGYHGSHSRDHRRDGYRERDRDRDYDNRNYNRRGGNYRGRSGYY